MEPKGIIKMVINDVHELDIDDSLFFKFFPRINNEFIDKYHYIMAIDDFRPIRPDIIVDKLLSYTCTCSSKSWKIISGPNGLYALSVIKFIDMYIFPADECTKKYISNITKVLRANVLNTLVDSIYACTYLTYGPWHFISSDVTIPDADCVLKRLLRVLGLDDKMYVVNPAKNRKYTFERTLYYLKNFRKKPMYARFTKAFCYNENNHFIKSQHTAYDKLKQRYKDMVAMGNNPLKLDTGIEARHYIELILSPFDHVSRIIFDGVIIENYSLETLQMLMDYQYSFYCTFDMLSNIYSHWMRDNLQKVSSEYYCSKKKNYSDLEYLSL